jgi:hypothetical protein
MWDDALPSQFVLLTCPVEDEGLLERGSEALEQAAYGLRESISKPPQPN